VIAAVRDRGAMRGVDVMRGSAVVSALVLLSLSVATVARADVISGPEPGQREVLRTLVVDASALPADRVVLFEHQRKYGGADPKAHPEPFRSPYRLSYAMTDRLVVVVTTRQVADTRPTLEDLERQHFVPRALHGPPREDVVESDRRWSLERKTKVAGNGEVEVLEDVYLDRAGAVLCRRAPIDETDFEEGRDPCDPSARSKRIGLFVRVHRTGLGLGGTGAVALLGAAIVARRRRRRTPAS
jgi:hypothetical protein